MGKKKSNIPKKIVAATQKQQQQPEVDEKKTKKLLTKGMNKLQGGNFSAAIELLTQVITQSSSKSILANAFSLRAEANYYLDNYQSVIEDYTTALKYEFDEDLARLFAQRGHAFLILKNFAGAVEDLERATKLRPEEFNILTNLGWAYDNINQKQKALDCYNKVINQQKKVRSDDLGIAYNNRALIFFECKDYVRAAEDFENAIIYQSSIDEPTYQNLTHLYLILKMYQPAKNFSEEGLKKYPKNQNLHVNYIQACFILGNFQNAIDHYHKYKLLISSQMEDIYNLGVGFFEFGLFDNAIEIFSDLVVIDANNVSYQRKLKAAKWENARKDGWEYFKNNYPIAVNSYESGHYVNVIDNLSEILKVNTDNEMKILLDDEDKSILFARRGLAYFHLKNFKAAQHDLEMARNLHVNSVLVYHALADIYISQEKFPTAYYVLTEAIKIDENYALSYSKCAQVHQALKNIELKEADEKIFLELTEKGKGQEAIVALTRKIEVDKGYFVENLYQRGILFMEDQRFAEAKKDFYVASQLNSQYYPALKTAAINLARQYLEQDKYQEAIEECKSVLANDKENEEIREIFRSATVKKYELGLKIIKKPVTSTDEEKMEEKTNTPII